MQWTPDDDPASLVDAAVQAAAALSTAPRFKAWCLAYCSRVEVGEPAALCALRSVWPKLVALPVPEVRRWMQSDAARALGEQEVSRWAMSGAARAAVEYVGVQRLDPSEAVLYAQKDAGFLAFMALQFAETARTLRAAPRDNQTSRPEEDYEIGP